MKWGYETGGIIRDGTKYAVAVENEDDRVFMTKKQAKSNPRDFYHKGAMKHLDKVCREYFCFGDFSDNIRDIMTDSEEREMRDPSFENDSELEAASEHLTKAVEAAGELLGGA